MPSARIPTPGREQLVRHIHDRLINRTAPRLELLLIVSLAGAAAFVTSVGGLRLGLESMAWRYPLAVAAGYVTFLLLIRIWIAWQRRRLNVHDAFDALDVASELRLERPDASSIARDEVPLFEAGRSGAEVVARASGRRRGSRRRGRRPADRPAAASIWTGTNCGRLPLRSRARSAAPSRLPL